jgi:hypothetical protein
MLAIDRILDTDTHLALEMVECDILNRHAHLELQAYNDHQIFRYRHPLTQSYKYYTDQFAVLLELKQQNPDAFIAQIANITQNIRRIESNLRKKKYHSHDEKNAWLANLDRAKIRKQILAQILAK